jgi:ABC-type uncharacterized transport system permease subunit
MGPHVLGWLAVAFYCAAEAVAIVSLVRGRGALYRLAPALVAAGLVLHFMDLMQRARILHSVPYRTLGGSVSFFGWMLGIAYLFLLLRHRERATGPFLIPFIILATAVGLLLPDAAAAAGQGLHGSVFALHVTLAILAYAAFALSFVLSVLYLVQNRQLRRKQTGLLFSRLPSLDVIARLNRTSVTVGLAVLTLSLALGVFWAEKVWPSVADPKVVWAVVTLAVYGFLLWMDRRGWEGPRVAMLSILGFGVVLFSYTVVNLYFSQAHSFR